MATKTTDNTDALTAIIKVLTPLDSAERHRAVQAAMLFLGEGGSAVKASAANHAEPKPQSEGVEVPGMSSRMRQYGIASSTLDSVFDFREDGTFAILDVPGRSVKERAHNIYVLTGLGNFLATGQRQFADDLARAHCEEHGCLDASNHSKMLKAKHPEFNGDKDRGWNISVPGLKSGVDLMKQVGGSE